MRRRVLAIEVPVLALAIFMLAPGAIYDKLAVGLRGVSAQRLSHSLLVDGAPLPLEARMYGIFVGFALAVGLVWLRGGYRRARLPRGPILVFLCLLVGAMALDGVNALLADVRGAFLYEPRNDLRLATGLLAGAATAGFVAPIVSLGFWKTTEQRQLYAGWTDLPLVLLASTVVALCVLSGFGGGGVLSAVGAAAVVGGAWMVGAHLWILLWDGVGQAERWSDLIGAEVVGLALGLGLLAGMAAIRGWMMSLGVTWGS
ncbi:MAG: hypothetical protein HW416_2206 [Chloroflexi bacterium]|nr:hypothetical protein [Chloroflexota bacterium]